MASLLANENTAFIQELCCHWLKCLGFASHTVGEVSQTLIARDFVLLLVTKPKNDQINLASLASLFPEWL